MTKKDFIIGIDMDDTIENLLDAWTDYLNAKYGYNYHSDDIFDWNLGKTYTELTEEQIVQPLHDNALWEKVKPKHDAVKYVKKLIDEGFTVYICTHSDYRTLETKMEKVLFKYFPFIDWNHVFVCHTKSLCKFDVLVDDYEKNLIYGSYIGILYHTAHNASFDETKYPRIYRRDNWESIYETIESLYEERLDEEWLNLH